MNAAKRRKNFLPAFLIAIFGWVGLMSIVFFISPQTKIGPVIFFLLFSLANFFTWSLVAGQTKLGLIVTLWLIWLLIMFRKQQLNWLSGFLSALFLILAALFSRKKTTAFSSRKRGAR